jgi:hypothetical protein
VGILILVVFVLVAAAWPQGANAQDQQCPQGTPRAVDADAPRFIAWGRSAPIRLQASPRQGAILSASEPVSVLTTTQVLRTYSAVDLAVHGVTQTVQMPQRASALRVEVVWAQELDLNFRGQCGMVLDFRIRGGRGKIPAGVRFSARGSSARISIGSANVPCNELARVPLTLQVAPDQQKPGRVRAADVCSNSGLGVVTEGWSLRQEGRQRFVFRAAKAARPGREVFTYRALAGSRLVGSGRFVVIRSATGRITIGRVRAR